VCQAGSWASHQSTRYTDLVMGAIQSKARQQPPPAPSHAIELAETSRRARVQPQSPGTPSAAPQFELEPAHESPNMLLRPPRSPTQTEKRRADEKDLVRDGLVSMGMAPSAEPETVPKPPNMLLRPPLSPEKRHEDEMNQSHDGPELMTSPTSRRSTWSKPRTLIQVNPFSGSEKGLERSTAKVIVAMSSCHFFTQQVGESTIPTLAPYFGLCSFEAPASAAAVLKRGDDAAFAGVLVSGQLTIKGLDQQPLYSLGKDDTLGETLVAVNRSGELPDDVFVRAAGTLLVTTLDALEALNLHQPVAYQALIDAFVARCITRSITETNYQPVTASKVSGPYVALIAHDARKGQLKDFCQRHYATLARCKLVGTATTGAMLLEKCGLKLAFKSPSGPLGGDLSIGALIAHDLVDAVIFLKDPLSIQAHYADIEALCQLCDVRNVPYATNICIGSMVVKHIAELMDLREGLLRLDGDGLPEVLAKQLRDSSLSPATLREQLTAKTTQSVMSRANVQEDEEVTRAALNPITVEQTPITVEQMHQRQDLPSLYKQTTLSVLDGQDAKLARYSSDGSSVLSEADTERGSGAILAHTLRAVRPVDELSVEALAHALGEHDLFTRSFTVDDLCLLAELMHVLEAPRGTRLLNQGERADCAVIVLSGRVELMQIEQPINSMADGSVRSGSIFSACTGEGDATKESMQLLASIGPGEMYGHGHVHLDKPVGEWPLSAEAARLTRVAVLPRSELERVRKRNSMLYNRINLWLGLMVLKKNIDTSELTRKYIIATCENTPGAKGALMRFIFKNKAFLLRNQRSLIGPSDIASEIEKRTGLTFVHTVQTPSEGGAMELGDLVCRSRVQACVVLRDHAAAHGSSFEALLRIADLYAVPSATNPATAELLVRHMDSVLAAPRPTAIINSEAVGVVAYTA